MRHYVSLFITGALMLFTGIYMMLRPSTFVAVVLSVFAVYMIFDGVRGIMTALRFRTLPQTIKNALFVKSAICILSGIAIIAISIAAENLLIPVFVYVSGAVFFVSGVINLTDYILLSRRGLNSGYLGFEIAFSFIIALLLFLFPNFIGTTVITIAAAIIFATGAVAITSGVYSIIFQRKLRSMVRKTDPGIPGQYDE